MMSPFLLKNIKPSSKNNGSKLDCSKFSNFENLCVAILLRYPSYFSDPKLLSLLLILI